jgi:hypothetical protein
MSVRLSACIKNFREIRYCRFSRKSIENIHIWLKSDKYIRRLTFRTKYVYTVDCSTIYFVARQQCKVKTLLSFLGNTQRFYIVYSDILLKQYTGNKRLRLHDDTSDIMTLLTFTYNYSSQTHRKHNCCVDTVTLVTRTPHTITLYAPCISCHKPLALFVSCKSSISGTNFLKTLNII